LLDTIPSWRQQGACATSTTPDLWFSDDRAEKLAAKAVCLSCPFKRECEEYGEGQEFGIWGGVDRSAGYRARRVTTAERKSAERAERQAAARQLLDHGLSLSEVGRRLGGLSHGSVRNLLAS
jgi:WhiB family redox-sensing transcriptional regulator